MTHDVRTAYAEIRAAVPYTDLVDVAEQQITARRVRPMATLALQAVAHKASTGAPQLTATGVEHTDLEAEVFAPWDPEVPLGDASGMFNRSFSDVFAGDGSASVSVMRDDPIVPFLIPPYMLRFRYKGVWAFLAAIKTGHQQTLAAVQNDGPEEADEIRTIACTEALHAQHKAVVLPTRWFNAGPDPQPKEQERQYNVGWNVFDDSGWEFAIQLAPQGQATIGWTGRPPAWPAPGAWYICGTGGDQAWAPPLGVMYDRRTFDIGEIGGGGKTSARLYFAADDHATVFLDAQQIADSGGALGTLTYVDFDLSDGEHTLCFIVKNRTDVGIPVNPDYGLPINPMMNLWTLMARDGDVVTGQLFDSVTGDELFSSQADRILFCPADAPGITAGTILLALDFDREARNIQTFWEPTYTRETDSAGAAWPILPNFVLHVGNDHAQAIRLMVTQGLIDVAVDPYRPVLYAYVGGTFGRNSGVTFPPPTEADPSNSLLELTHDTDEPRATHLLVEYATGRVLVAADEYDESMERIEASLDFGKVHDAATVTAWAKILLSKSSQNYSSTGAAWDPADPTHDPYVNPALVPGNFVNVSDDTLTGTRTERLVSVTISEDDEGVVTVQPELNDLLLYREQLVRQWLERSAPDQLGGLYPVGQTAAPVDSSAVEARTPGFNFTLGDIAGTIVDTDVHLRVMLREVIVTRMEGTPPVPSVSGESQVTVYLTSGANAPVLIATVTLPDSPPAPKPVWTATAVLSNQLTVPNVDRLTCVLVESNGARHTVQIRTEAA